MRGETASELVFHTFLSFMADSGGLVDRHAKAADVRAALRCTISLIDNLAAQDGATLPAFSILVANGDFIVGVHGRQRMAYRVLEGRDELEAIIGASALSSLRVPAVESSRVCMLIGDSGHELPGFTELDDQTIITLGRGANLHADVLDVGPLSRVASAA